MNRASGASRTATTIAPAEADTLTSYTFEPVGITVRAIVRDGAPWFVAKDVCDALGLRVDNSVRGLSAHERANTQLKGFARGATIINESGLYAVIMRSRKAEAQQFREWVTGTVLPSINRNGGYLTGEERLSQADRDALHVVCRAELERMVQRVDDDTWHDSLKSPLTKAERMARVIEHRAAQMGIPLSIAKRTCSGDVEGAAVAYVALRRGQQ